MHKANYVQYVDCLTPLANNVDKYRQPASLGMPNYDPPKVPLPLGVSESPRIKNCQAPKATQNNDPSQKNIPLASAHRDPLTYWQERNAMFLFSSSKFQQSNIMHGCLIPMSPTANGTLIRSSVLAQLTLATNRHTHKQITPQR